MMVDSWLNKNLMWHEGWPPRLAALITVLTFATLPTFWRWATSAKTYTLNILCLSIILYLLSRLPKPNKSDLQGFKNLVGLRHTHYAILILGLSIAVHNTMLLLTPGLALFIILHQPALFRQPKTWLILALCYVIPLAFYLYIPLRAEWLIADMGRTAAIEHGLLANFYDSDLTRYFSAADFTQGVKSDWGLVPGRIYPLYIAGLLADEMSWLGIGLGFIGGLFMAITRPRLFIPLFLLYITPIPFVLAYGQGEQTAFLLPSFLIFALFIGYTLQIGAIANERISKWANKQKFSSLTSYLSFLTFLLLISYFIYPRITYNFNWLENKWTRASYNEWHDALNHPLEPNAGLLAEWGDLTSAWYLQHVEQLRPDLRGIYPPTEEMVQNVMDEGQPLYLAGKIDPDKPQRAWIRHLAQDYRLIPWGRLVRLAPMTSDPQRLLPTLPHELNATFDNKLHLRQADFAPQATGGQPYTVTLTWQALTDLPPETTLSLRLVQGDTIVAQLDDSLLSGWFPSDHVSAQQYGLSYALIPIPLGTLTGQYRLQAAVYAHHSQPWRLPDGAPVLDLGEVELISPLTPATLLPRHDFNAEIELNDWDYTVSRVGQGKGFAVRLLWHARARPEDNYTLLAELVDESGHVLRNLRHEPPLPTGSWQTGQFIRDQINFVLPASAPAGEAAVHVRLSWQRPDGSKLTNRNWLISWGDNLALGKLAVIEKQGRVFELPSMTHPYQATFGDSIALLGYDLEQPLSCAAGCTLNLTVYWQGLKEMLNLYSVFVHVIDERGQMVSQQDKVPGIRGKQPTTGWLPNEIITDPIELTMPPSLPPGRYILRLGLYLPPNGARLPVKDSPHDFVDMGTVELGR